MIIRHQHDRRVYLVGHERLKLIAWKQNWPQTIDKIIIIIIIRWWWWLLVSLVVCESMNIFWPEDDNMNNNNIQNNIQKQSCETQ